MERRSTSPNLIPQRYFSHDPIGNLRIRVTLKKSRHQGDTVLASAGTYKSILLKIKSDRVQTLHKREQQGAVPQLPGVELPDFKLPELKEVVLEKTFHWQEKVYTAREILRACHTKHVNKSHLDRTYETEIRALLKGLYKTEEPEASSRSHVLQQGGCMISSKVDVDDYIHPDQLKECVTTSTNRALNPLAASLVKGTGGARGVRKDMRSTVMTVLGCVDLPDKDDQIKHWVKATRAGHEQILYQIKLFDNGTFVISPQFSAGGPSTQASPHVFRSPAGVWYEYWIENMSQQSVEASPPLATVGKKIKAVVAKPAPLLNRPSEGYFRLNLFGEIVSAIGFEGGAIWCQYELHIPEGWQWSKHDQKRMQSSVTQMSKSAEMETDYGTMQTICHFNHPIELELQGRTDDPCFPWPSIYLQVNSQDWWERERAEGYGYVQVPSVAGCHDLSVALWRPSGSTHDATRRFFLGGAPTLQDISQGGLTDKDRDRGVLNRYGFSSVQTGSVQVRLNVVLTSGQVRIIRRVREPLNTAPLAIEASIDQMMHKEKAIFDAIQALRASAMAPAPPNVQANQRKSIGIAPARRKSLAPVT